MNALLVQAAASGDFEFDETSPFNGYDGIQWFHPSSPDVHLQDPFETMYGHVESKTGEPMIQANGRVIGLDVGFNTYLAYAELRGHQLQTRTFKAKAASIQPKLLWIIKRPTPTRILVEKSA
jgi:hypothetical protein